VKISNVLGSRVIGVLGLFFFPQR